MVADIGFWNSRGLLTSPSTQESVREEGIDTGLVTNTVKKLGALLNNKRLQLWSEVATIKAVIYKHHNQHRKEKYFQGLKMVVKCLKRLEEIGIHEKVTEVKDKFPRLSKRGTLVKETLSSYPPVEMIVNILGYFTGAAKLMMQVMSLCKATYQHCCAQLAYGFFLTFHLTCVASLSRVWVFIRDFLSDVIECYDVMFPWLQLLAGPQKKDHSTVNDLPESLKTLLEPPKGRKTAKSNRNSLTPPTNITTPGILEKLFESTPRDQPKDEAASLPEPVCDLGESFISDEPYSLLETTLTDTEELKPINWCSSSPITVEHFNLKRKLFADKPRKWQDEEECEENTKQTAKFRKRIQFVVSKRSSCKHRSKASKRLKSRGRNRSDRSLSCRVMHVFSDERWKRYKEELLQKKLRSNYQEGGPSRRRGNKGETVSTPLFSACRENEPHAGRIGRKHTIFNNYGKFISSRNSMSSYKECPSPENVTSDSGSTPRRIAVSKNNRISQRVKDEVNPSETISSTFDENNFIEHQTSLLSKALSSSERSAEREEQKPFQDDIDDIFSMLND